MARDEAAPFARGETYYNGGTIDSTNLGGINLEGKEYTLEVNTPDSSPTGDPSGRQVRVRVVRNTSSIPLLPSRLVINDATYAYMGCRVSGYTNAVGTVAEGVVDEFLPAAGVPVNDLFYIVVYGPTIVETVTASLGTVAVGTKLVPGTGTSSVSSDSGLVQAQDLTGATATLGNNIQNVIAESQVATSTTSALIAAVVRPRR